MLTEALSDFFDSLGAEWVLWLLVILSAVSVLVIVERALYFRRNSVDMESLRKRTVDALRRGGKDEARKVVAGVPGMAGGVLDAALEAYDDGVESMEEVIAASITLQRSRYDRFLGILGTLGNNAPFIGLLGTVIGIINAFGQLAGALEGSARTQQVMHSISEALVATGVGLAVAIPAVIAFNVFKNRIRRMAADSEWLARHLLAYLKATPNRAQGPALVDGAAAAGAKEA